jgi:hypothetical protein
MYRFQIYCCFVGGANGLPSSATVKEAIDNLNSWGTRISLYRCQFAVLDADTICVNLFLHLVIPFLKPCFYWWGDPMYTNWLETSLSAGYFLPYYLYLMEHFIIFDISRNHLTCSLPSSSIRSFLIYSINLSHPRLWERFMRFFTWYCAS